MQKEEIVLNKQQKEAITFNIGPLLIIAGAGTGKTTVITERIKFLIGSGSSKPEEILALTFTEKAAHEMESRVDVALPYGTYGLWISTFHSFCDRILRNEVLNIGLPTNFKLLTEAETYLFVKKNFWSFDLKYFRPNGNPYKFIEGLIQHFSRLKDEDTSTKDYLSFVEAQISKLNPFDKLRSSTPRSLRLEEVDPEQSRRIKTQNLKQGPKAELKEEYDRYLELANAYKVYEELKVKEGVMDFSDLIGNTLKLFRKRKSILAKYQKQFKYILVDEFQDTNFAQYQLIKLLAPTKKSPNLTVVGDDSQSIYKFRGAAISNILSFMNDYPDSKKVILTTSYRCSQTILDAAYRLIKNNNPNTLESKLGISKDLRASQSQKDRIIEFIHTDRVEEEAEQVVNFIRKLKMEFDREYKDFAILVRANNHSEPFIRALERANIPYQFLGPGALFKKKEVKDLIAYLKVLYDFTDSVSLYRVLSMNIWQLNARDLIALLNLAKKSNISFFEQLENLESIKMISQSSKIELKKFVDMVHRQQKLISKETAGQILYYFLQESGLLKQVVEYKTQSEETRALNITKFFDRLKSFEATHEDSSVFAVVDYLDLAMSLGESPLAAEVDWTQVNAVNILTVHSAKGLEFRIVFLTNLVEGRFPTRERKEQIPVPEELIKEELPVGDYHLQEERRLFYVGMTRAEEQLILTASDYYGEGKRERKLSPFIKESLGTINITNVAFDLKTSQIPLFEWKKTPDEKNLKEVQTGQKLHLDYLSYSAVEAFKICPLHFKLRYILRIPTVPTAAQSMGVSIHRALKDFYTFRKNLQSDKSDKSFLLKLLDTNWIGLGYKSKKHEQQAKDKVKIFLENYLKNPLHRFATPIFLEKEFNFRIDPTLKILGIIDRIDDLGDGKIEIIDYKTGVNLPTQKQLDSNLQMTIYALASVNPAVLKKKLNQVKMTFYYFEKSKILSTMRSQEQLNDALTELLKIRADIEKSDFNCSRGIICQNCEYKMLCND